MTFKLDKYQVRDVRRRNRDEERRQFFFDVWIDPYSYNSKYWTVDGWLDGKNIPPWRYSRYLVLGWISPIMRPPWYELTTAGEQVYRAVQKEVEKDVWEYFEEYDFDLEE